VNDIFYNNKYKNKKNLDTKQFSSIKNQDRKTYVDINKLLNRVKLDHKDEIKQKMIFLSFGIFLLFSMGIFVSIIR
tara:strand:+ start:265 stop:492 length:228 start_codon:yes stop_codon:yes gene_type:complete